MRLRVWLLAGLSATACGSTQASPPPPDAAVSAMQITLGTVDADGAGFLPLAGDQPLIPGSQSGFHVWLKYRVRGAPEGLVRVKRTVRRVSDGRLVLRAEGVQEIGAPDEGGLWELPEPLPSFMCPTPLGVRVADEPMRFTVELVDAESDATLATGTAEATPRCPDGEQRAFCERICTG